jgi:hypothetical protein
METRATVAKTALDSNRSLCIEAVGFTQGTETTRRASVDVAAETTRFEVLIYDHNTGDALSLLAGGAEMWLTKAEAQLYAQGFMAGREDSDG